MQLGSDSSAAERRRRGYRLEAILNSMLEESGLDPRTRFRPRGEELDGSFMHGERPMLLEAKWTQAPQQASSLYQFKGKIDGKLIGTIGLFISMGGYSNDAVPALIAGKSINLILMDRDDMVAIADDKVSFKQALAFKLRAAAEEGTPYVPLTSYRADGSAAALTSSDKGKVDQAGERALFIVEGALDMAILQGLCLAWNVPPNRIGFAIARGRLNLSRLARVMDENESVGNLALIADGDGDPQSVRAQVLDDLDQQDEFELARKIRVIVPDRNLADSLGFSPDEQKMTITIDRAKRHFRQAGPSDVASNSAAREILETIGVI